ncbi:NB-ARC domain-containing protein [Micromonospora peucetia]|uniref:NB-ARC domain-containing protein n=1 Tax=Micromonospora peucetia TaxID=47871 RepID=A0ABZ1ENU7_9ACTN|nr:NB-ARC domain-containing protein [Micromonospora peucetia]WSA35887.1 NB-ARC domain-containing protein [Micromonospora peucetia]
MVFVVAAAWAATAASVSVNVLTETLPSWLRFVERSPWWWTAGSSIGAGLLGAAVWWSQRRYELGLAELVPAEQRPERWMVDRPAEVREIVQAVLHGRGAETVGITTAVHGAGGFGKTTVARLVRADRRLLRHFDGRVFWVTLGRDVRRGALVEKVNDLVRRIDPGRAQPFTDVRQGAEHLAAVLADGPRRLIVLDDVWFDDQLAAFPVAGKCARLVTTRMPSLVAGQVVPVRVDQMSLEQALRVLTADLPRLPSTVVDALLVETGRWPLLLRLTNRNLVAQAQSHADIAVVAGDLLQRLRREGPLRTVGQLPEVGDVEQLDINDPDQRSKAVAATIEASAGLLTDRDRSRLTELAVFAEDEIIPVPLVAVLWHATGGLDKTQTRMACARLADLALVTLTPTDNGGAVGLHDVVRDYLLEHLGVRVRQVHRVFLDAVAADLPPALDACGNGSAEAAAWWELPERARYMREHLVEHLRGAGRDAHAEALVTDLRWVQSRLQETGPAGPFTDLGQISTPRAARLRRLVGQTAHLLARTDPAHSLLDILYSRVAHDPDWGPQAQTLARTRTMPALVSTSPLPDVPHAASRRVLTGHTRPVNAVAITPDGTWLATSDDDGVVRVWDAVTGAERTTLIGHTGPVTAVAIAPDGTWLATGGDGGVVRVWDVVTGAERATFTGPTWSVKAVTIAADGTWLATGHSDGSVQVWSVVTGAERAAFDKRTWSVVAIAPDGTWWADGHSDGAVRVWDAVTGAERTTFTGCGWPVKAVVIAPDGTWLAAGGDDGVVRVWNVATGAERATLPGYPRAVHAVAIAPDGTWLAAGHSDGAVRVWDAVTGAERTTFTGHRWPVNAVAIAPDGTWLATGDAGGAVRVWDAVTGEEPATLTGHTKPVHAVAIAPDGTWLATGGEDRAVRAWDTATSAGRATLTGHTWPVRAVAIAPDGTWLATGGDDVTVLMWDVVTGAKPTELSGHIKPVYAVAIAPDGTWLATGDAGGAVRVWDAVTGAERATFTGHTWGVYAVAIAPDGTWLATAGNDGAVWMWNVVGGEFLGQADGEGVVTGTARAVFTGHRWPVNTVAIAPDGTWLATGDERGVVWVWDAVTGAARATLTGHTGSVTAVAITSDGNWLATVGDDQTVRIWRASNGELVAMMRTDEHLSCCAWNPHSQQLILGGRAGLYRFEFKPPTSQLSPVWLEASTPRPYESPPAWKPAPTTLGAPTG